MLIEPNQQGPIASCPSFHHVCGSVRADPTIGRSQEPTAARVRVCSGPPQHLTYETTGRYHVKVSTNLILPASVAPLEIRVGYRLNSSMSLLSFEVEISRNRCKLSRQYLKCGISSSPKRPRGHGGAARPLISSAKMSSSDQSSLTVGESSMGSIRRKSSSSSIEARPVCSSLLALIMDAIAKSSAILHDWTPFLLVTTYVVVSVCVFCVCSTNFTAVFWFVCLTTNFYIAGSTVVEAFISLTPIREARQAVMKAEERRWKFPTPDVKLPIIDLIIVAYLPNEKDIILDRALYALEKIVYPKDRIRINVVYNTPHSIEPLETELRNLMVKHGILRVFKVPNSTSKADNLNYFFTLDTGADVIAIFDCDHYTHPYGPRWAAERFVSNKKIDIVQGRCVIFNPQESWLAAMIAVEFDKIYAVSHPGRAAMWGFGLFTGSNGYWRASLIKEMKMDGTMLTEDIDSALRAVARNAKTVHDSNVISYELAPVTWRAFWKQRLRWTQGWTQASIK